MHLSRPRRCVFALGSALVLSALAGCSASDVPAVSSSPDGTKLLGESTSYPLTINNCGYEQTFEKAPQRVVILNGASVSEAETILMLGLGNSVLANAQNYGVSDNPDLVAQVNSLPTADLSMGNFDIPSEQLLAFKPDLVIANSSGGFDKNAGQASREELANIGVRSIVNPPNCALGKDDATDAERAAFSSATVESSFDLVNLLGNIFDVHPKAAALVEELQSQLDAASKPVEGLEQPSGLIVFPGMSMMSTNGLPAVMAGGFFDDVLNRSGVASAFAGAGPDLTSSITEEQLASANVQVLVVGGFTPGEDLDAAAAEIFAEYPQWEAAKNNRYVTVSDGVYAGPTNPAAIAKIARAAHPDAF